MKKFKRKIKKKDLSKKLNAETVVLTKAADKE